MTEQTIETGDGFKPKERVRRTYPFDSLKKKGAYFIITDLDAEVSLRSQATKQKTRRGIDFRVEKTDTVNGVKRPQQVLVVCHAGKYSKK